ncbi:MAG: SRPBCC family protein [Solirubrobacterales bacterium]|nr:SRPBCC family protein [Solirubrobacterales bacterium]
MSTVAVSIDIAAPVQVVWDFAMDPRSTLEWVTIARSVGAVDEGPLRVGFEMEQTLALRGVPFKVAWTLVAIDAPHFARWEGHGPARSRAVIEDRLSERDGGTTHFHYTNSFRAPFGPLGSVASRTMVGGIPEKEAMASLSRLKRRLEATGPGDVAAAAG